MPRFAPPVPTDNSLTARRPTIPSPISGVAAYPVMLSALFSRTAAARTQPPIYSAPDLSKLEGPVSSFWGGAHPKREHAPNPHFPLFP